MKCSEQEFKKFFILVEQGRLQNKTAAEACGYSGPHFSALRKKYKELGDRIFTHGLKGRKPANATPHSVQKFVVEQYLKEHDDKSNPINFNYWRSELEESHGIKLSYRTLYGIMTSAGIESPECHRPRKERTHRMRFRRRFFGELLQWDATPYQWFMWAGDTRYYTLHGVMDDSRSTYLALYMTENECRYGYIECRRQVLTKYGVELEDYSDRSPVFHNNCKESARLSVEEQIAGTTRKKALWESMDEELGICLHLASSPQAKGKIERGWKTAQWRLPNEFRKRGIRTIEAANAYLESEFCDYYSSHFAKNKGNVSVFRALDEGINMRNLLCVKERRTVNRSGRIHFKGLELQVKGIKSTGVTGDLCINDRGMWFSYRDRNFDVELKDGDLADAPQVLENIIYECMFREMHAHAA